MIFDPGISVGEELTNNEMRVLFKYGNMGACVVQNAPEH